MITRLTYSAFSICAEVHVPAPLHVYPHRADLIQEFGRRNATFWVSWKVPARGTASSGPSGNRRDAPSAAYEMTKTARGSAQPTVHKFTAPARHGVWIVADKDGI